MPAIARILAAITTQTLSVCENGLICPGGGSQNDLEKICVTALNIMASKKRYIAWISLI